MAGSLDMLFRPRSVAVIGASRERNSIGAAVLANLVRGEFCGPVFPINPHAAHVGSLKAYPSVLDVPDPIDLAVIVVPKEHAVPVLEECGKKGVRGVVVITAGFREIGGRGAELEAGVKAMCKQHGMRLVGPNCMGILNTEPGVRLNATFAKTAPVRGPVAFLSQSGALGEAVLDRARQIGVGLAMFASIGNKADVSSNDLLEYWGAEPSVEVILLYLENFGNPLNFSRIAREVSRRKPVIAVKSGRTAAGARAASSHTGSLAGSDTATEALLAQCGVLRALTVEELFDLAKAFSLARPPAGRRVAVISNAGGPAILAADACSQWGLEVPPLQPATRDAVRARVHADASLENPVDLIASALPEHYRTVLGPALADPGIDAAVVLCVPPATIDTVAVARAIAEPPPGKPVVSCFMGIAPEALRLLERAGVPVFDFPESAVRALSALARYRELRDRPAGQVPEVKADRALSRALIERVRGEGRRHLTLGESLELLSAYGIPVAPTRIVTEREQAIDAARALGYPVVLKSGTGGHKTEKGAVALDLRSTDDLVAAWERIFSTPAPAGPGSTPAPAGPGSTPAPAGPGSTPAPAGPGSTPAPAGPGRPGPAAADLLPAVVQPMCTGGREVALGITTDRDLGPLVMFGLGGIFVEVLQDVAFRLVPLTDIDVREMFASVRGLPLLTGFRGSQPVDLEAVARALHGIAALAVDFPEVAELDVNPFLAFPAGREPLAVDARVRLA